MKVSADWEISIAILPWGFSLPRWWAHFAGFRSVRASVRSCLPDEVNSSKLVAVYVWHFCGSDKFGWIWPTTLPLVLAIGHTGAGWDGLHGQSRPFPDLSNAGSLRLVQNKLRTKMLCQQVTAPFYGEIGQKWLPRTACSAKIDWFTTTTISNKVTLAGARHRLLYARSR